MAQFYVIRLEATSKRRRHLIDNYKNNLSYICQKITFVRAVLGKKIRIQDKKDDILAQALECGLSHEFTEEFMKMSIISLSAEKVEKMEHERVEIQKHLDFTTNTSVEDFYKKDLRDLQNNLDKHNKKRKRDD